MPSTAEKATTWPLVLIQIFEFPPFVATRNRRSAFGDMPAGLHGAFMIGLDEGPPGRGGNHGVLALGNIGERVAHRMNAAPLPCRAEGAGDGGLQPLMSIGDHQLDAGETPVHQVAQEAHPERLGFGRTDVQTDDFPFPIRVDGHRDCRRHRHVALALAHLQIGRIEP